MADKSMMEWYKGKNVLVTGGTGFMGKVLIEKMLRSLPEINKIYMLIRTKKGQTPYRRIETMLKLPLFAKVMKQNPNCAKKLVPIRSELANEDLGISKEDQAILIEDVHTVFHLAATLRLEADVVDAIKLNTVGTTRMLDFCKKLTKLESIIYVSTAFCYCDLEVLDEKVYPPQKDPHEIMALCENKSKSEIKLMEKDLLYPHPNSYIFSKRLNEKLVDDVGQELPVCIVRPSIVLPTLAEPFPGWVDSLNGPMGVSVAAGKGVLRSMMCEEKYTAEAIPVDIAANAMLIIAWKRARKSFDHTPVYNLTSGDSLNVTWGEVLERGRKLIYDYPYEWTLWYPAGGITTNRFIHYLVVIFFQYLPAYFIDFLLLIFMQKRFMVRVQNKISQGLDLLEYFTSRQWTFTTNNGKRLIEDMSEVELEVFPTANVKFDMEKYFKDMLIGSRTYLMKENPKSLPFWRFYIRILYCVHIATQIWICYFLLKLGLGLFGFPHLMTVDYWKKSYA